MDLKKLKTRNFCFIIYSSENNKVSDAEMYHALVESIEKLCNMPPINTCKHQSTTEVYRCYQDRYVKRKCNVCNKELYFDL